MPRRPLAAIVAFLVLMPAVAQAHKPSDSYLTVSVADDAVTGRWDIALRDLDHAIGLDTNDDGAITWGELRARHEAVDAYALARLDISTRGLSCGLRATDNLTDQHSDGGYAVLYFAVDCPVAEGFDRIDGFDVSYDLFFDLDPQHRGLVQIAHGDSLESTIFSPDTATQSFALGAPRNWRQFGVYVREGAWHIWIGLDHVLFLLTLLFPAVLRRQGGRWVPVARLQYAVGQILMIVTAFTVAHSITLGLAALEILELPSRLVESVIAASVVVAAVNNLTPIVTRRLWLVAFVFGLIHGFGFAGALADLGLPPGALLIALFEFNLGVELGQIAIVAGFLPVAILLRNSAVYPRFVLPAGSIAVAAVAMIWLLERAFAVPIGSLFS